MPTTDETFVAAITTSDYDTFSKATEFSETDINIWKDPEPTLPLLGLEHTVHAP